MHFQREYLCWKCIGWFILGGIRIRDPFVDGIVYFFSDIHDLFTPSLWCRLIPVLWNISDYFIEICIPTASSLHTF